MNTPAHLIFGLAAFGKPDAPKVTAAALAGALIPDLSLYLMAGTHLFVLGTDPQIVFGELYFSDAWQSIFRIDNSFIVWGVLLGIGLALRSAWIMALAGAALLHIGLDFPLHHDDGRAHFWPLTDWVFQSPVSYWDTNHHAGLIGPIEIGLCLLFGALLWRRYAPKDPVGIHGRARAVAGTAVGALSLSATLLLWISGFGMRGLIVVLCLLEAAPVLVWMFVFSGA